MPEFTKYMHIERLQNQEVEDILDGNVYVFYKIDGTNVLSCTGTLRSSRSISTRKTAT